MLFQGPKVGDGPDDRAAERPSSGAGGSDPLEAGKIDAVGDDDDALGRRMSIGNCALPRRLAIGHCGVDESAAKPSELAIDGANPKTDVQAASGNAGNSRKFRSRHAKVGAIGEKQLQHFDSLAAEKADQPD